MIHVYHNILQVGDSSGWAMLSALLLSNPQLCEPDCWTPGRILMGEFYRCDSWGRVLSTCENQVSCLQSQPGHSKIIMQILKNNEIGLENRMGLGILCFICLMVFLPFAAMYSNLPFFPLHSKENWDFLLNENKESSHKSPDFQGYDFRKNIQPHQINDNSQKWITMHIAFRSMFLVQVSSK